MGGGSGRAKSQTRFVRKKKRGTRKEQKKSGAGVKNETRVSNRRWETTLDQKGGVFPIETNNVHQKKVGEKSRKGKPSGHTWLLFTKEASPDQNPTVTKVGREKR